MDKVIVAHSDRASLLLNHLEELFFVSDSLYFLQQKVFKNVITINDKQEGIYITFHDGGNRRSERTYIHGKVEGRVFSWYSDGTKQMESNFSDGRRMENGCIGTKTVNWIKKETISMEKSMGTGFIGMIAEEKE